MAAWNDSNTGYLSVIEYEELNRILISVSEGSVGIQVGVSLRQAKEFFFELETAIRKVEERKMK